MVLKSILGGRAAHVLKHQYRILRKRTSPFTNLTFEVTFKCNARCVMCFNWKQRDSKTKSDLTLEEINKFSKTVGPLQSVTLGGGEPTLRKDLAQICEVFYKNNNARTFIIPTNSLLPAKIAKDVEEILSAHDDSYLMINLSIDGVGKVHDKIRGVKGTFKKVLETYKALSKLKKKYGARLIIGANTIICNYNENEIMEVADYVRTKMKLIGNHTFEAIRGNFDGMSVRPPSMKKYMQIMKKIKAIAPNNSILHSYYLKLSLCIIEEKRQVIPCLAGYVNPVVDSYGNVYICEVLPPIGNLKDYDYDFMAVWNSKKANEVRKDISEGKCYCTHFCYQYPSILYSPTVLLKAIANWYVSKIGDRL